MKRNNWLLALLLVLTVFGGIACRQQSPDVATATPIAGETAVSGGPAYPAPEETAEVPDEQPPAEEPSPTVAAPDDQPEPEEPGDGESPADPTPESPGSQPEPVEPTIRTAAGSPEPLPAATVIAAPEGGNVSIQPGSTVQHTVSAGEWLLQVARCYGASYEAVRNANYIPIPDFIVPGMVLTIPNVGSEGPVAGPPCVMLYTVGAGETWDSIASQFGTTASLLQRANPGPLTAGREIHVPAVHSGDGALVPDISNHLLFILNGDLAVWRASDNQVEVTPDQAARILDITTNTDGRFVLARQTRDDGVTNEIVLIDTQSRTEVLLDSGLMPPPAIYTPYERMLIAPDGSWGVYAIRSASGYKLVSFQTSAPTTLYETAEIAYTIPDDPAPAQIFPGGNSTRFMVATPRGFQEYPYSLDLTARDVLLLTGDWEVDPFQGAYGEVWDPTGRYLLAMGYFIEGGAHFVIDSESGEAEQLPGSNAYVIVPDSSWTTGGVAQVLEPTIVGDLGPRSTLYEPESDAGLVLNPVSTVTFETLSTPKQAEPQPGYVILAPSLQPAGATFLAIQGDTEEQGVWRASGFLSGPMTRLNDIPNDAYIAEWTLDFTGMVVTTPPGLVGPAVTHYIPLDGSPVFSLSAWLGDDMGDFHWVMPQ